MKFLISFALILCFYFVSAAQIADSASLPELKYDQNSQLVGIFDTSENTDFSCGKSVETLILKRILYEDENSTDVIGNLIFADEKGRREEYVFRLELSEFSNADSTNLRQFIAQGNSYRVGAYRCGAGGRSDPYIYSLQTSIKSKSVKTKRRVRHK